MSAPERRPSLRNDADCAQRLRARFDDPAVVAWLVVVLLALLPLRAAIVGA